MPAQRLIRTKLFIPHPHPELVDRPWLINRLNEGLNTRLTVVSAPAGSGKTTLLSRWVEAVLLQNPTFKIGWISLDDRDNEPLRFWTYFAAALQTLWPEAAETGLEMLNLPQHPPVETVLDEWINSVAEVAEEDFALVLDDYHVVEDPAIHQALNYWLEHLPPTMHIFVAGRSQPNLPLALLRARRQVVEVTPEELRFNLSEAQDFFNQVMNLNLPLDDVKALEQLTEGWAAGLQLAGLSLQSTPESDRDLRVFLQTFTGSHRYIFDYLIQEVLSRQPERVQEFLLKTSILERLSAALCDQVSGLSPSQEVLEYLVTNNLFTTRLDPNRQWYRYHHLFSDFLQKRLEGQLPAGEVHSLHLRASQWYLEQGMYSDAIEQALQAKDYDRAAELVRLTGAGMFTANELTALRGMILALPKELVKADAKISMTLAWAVLATSQWQQVAPLLDDIEQVYGVQADGSAMSFAQPAEVRGALGEVCCIRANLAFHSMQPNSVLELSHRAEAYLGQDVVKGLFHRRDDLLSVIYFNQGLAYELNGEIDKGIQAIHRAIQLGRQQNNSHLVSLSISHLASMQLQLGKLRQAEATYREGLELLEQGVLSPSPMIGLAYAGLGNILCERGDLEPAESTLQKGIELGKIWANLETLLSAYPALARLEFIKGNFSGAFGSIDELEKASQGTFFFQVSENIESMRAVLNARQGDRESAQKSIRPVTLPVEGGAPSVLVAYAAQQARLLLTVSRYEEALRLVEPLLASAVAAGRGGQVIELSILHALAQSGLGNAGAALDSLGEAIKLAAPEGYRRIFLDEGKPMQDLLRRLCLSSAGHEEKDYAQSLLQNDDDPKVLRGQPAGSHLLPDGETLSERELELLRLIAAGLSNADIAARLYISNNTVKTHVKSIISKLGVHNRTEAAARARQLGLL